MEGGVTSPNKAINAVRNLVRGAKGGSFEKLRTIGRKKCLSFALNLLLHVDSVFNMCSGMIAISPRIHWTQGA